MADDKEPPQNFFVRFKRHVDHYVGSGLQSILGLPSLVNRELALTLGVPRTGGGNETTKNDHSRGFDKSGGSSGDSGNGDSSGWNGTERNDKVEAFISLLVNGKNPQELSAIAWKVFFPYSPYSPFRLDSEVGMPPCPQPRDAQLAYTRARWTDVFEDLLRTTSAMSPKHPAIFGTIDADADMFSLPSPAWAEEKDRYLDRLAQHHLLEAYFPYYDMWTGYRSPSTLQEWAKLRQNPPEYIPWAAPRFFEDLARKNRDEKPQPDTEEELYKAVGLVIADGKDLASRNEPKKGDVQRQQDGKKAGWGSWLWK